MPRVLIVDDEIRQMQALCQTLPDYGFEVVGCPSGALALDAIRTTSFDLILTDLMMPGMDGITLLDLALKADPNLVGILMTGEGTIATAVEAMQVGALDYILKPFKISAALPVLQRSLKVRQLRQENVRLQRQAREHMDELGRFFLVSRDLLCILDPNGVFKQANSEWQTILGHSETDVLTMSLLELVHPEDREETDFEVASLSSGSLEVAHFENRCRQAGGNYRRLSWTMSKAGDLIYAGARDVTEERAMETAVRHAKEQAEEANRAKSEFLSRMSHELRTPLNAILGFAQLLDLEYEDAGIKEASSLIQKGGHHLLQLINEVLDLSRIEGGHLSIAIEPVEVSKIFGQAMGMIRPIAKSTGIEVLVDTESGEGVYVSADPQRLLQVVINLLSNAIKYNRPNGQVRLRYAEGIGSRGRIEVSDTGIGISTDDQLALFRPFRRFCNPGIEGTGLGLALSERLVRLMDGQMGLSESTETGSTFFVQMSGAEAPLTELPLPQSPAADLFSSGLNGKVLYIEDNLSNMRLLDLFFAKWKRVELIPAAQGLVGLELARQHLPDMILLDLHLPDIMGDEVLRRLKDDSATGSIPVVVLSADASPAQIQTMLSLGSAEYLTKPLNLHRLFEVLCSFLPSSVPSRAA